MPMLGRQAQPGVHAGVVEHTTPAGAASCAISSDAGVFAVGGQRHEPLGAVQWWSLGGAPIEASNGPTLKGFSTQQAVTYTEQWASEQDASSMLAHPNSEHGGGLSSDSFASFAVQLKIGMAELKERMDHGPISSEPARRRANCSR
ncbi:hypothetical protein FOA52_015215 [Chlamydomonas sp. UWO 241]|nr:hypothetical protein FOA52_015215 [Chlamydomonas sp. UWO 241]